MLQSGWTGTVWSRRSMEFRVRKFLSSYCLRMTMSWLFIGISYWLLWWLDYVFVDLILMLLICISSLVFLLISIDMYWLLWWLVCVCVLASCVLSQGELHQDQRVTGWITVVQWSPQKLLVFINTRSEQKKVAIYVFLSNLKKKTYLQITMFVYFTQGINRQQSPRYLILTIQGGSPGDG